MLSRLVKPDHRWLNQRGDFMSGDIARAERFNNGCQIAQASKRQHRARRQGTVPPAPLARRLASRCSLDVSITGSTPAPLQRTRRLGTANRAQSFGEQALRFQSEGGERQAGPSPAIWIRPNCVFLTLSLRNFVRSIVLLWAPRRDRFAWFVGESCKRRSGSNEVERSSRPLTI